MCEEIPDLKLAMENYVLIDYDTKRWVGRHIQEAEKNSKADDFLGHNSKLYSEFTSTFLSYNYKIDVIHLFCLLFLQLRKHAEAVWQVQQGHWQHSSASKSFSFIRNPTVSLIQS